MLDRVERSLAAREVEDAKKARQLFDSIATGYGDVRWYGLQGRTIGALCERARYADVVIVGQEATEASPERARCLLQTIW
jgi:hypothetical protein